MIDALIKCVSVTYKCYEMYAHRGKKVQLLVFWQKFTILADNAPLNYLFFQSFDFEHSWWRLFQKHVVSCELNLISTFLLLNSDKILLHNAQAKQHSNSTWTVNIIKNVDIKFSSHDTTCFWNNLHQECSKSKDWKNK
jgi:hypothetical protein